MAAIRSLEQGIQAVQQGKLSEGGRLIRIALKDETLVGSLRATAYIWLAETTDDRARKIQCYNDALNADPGNEHAKQRLSRLFTQELPPLPEAAPPPQPEPPTAAAPVMPPAPPEASPPLPTYTPPSAVVPQPHQPPQPAAAQPGTFAPFYRTVGIVGGPNGTGTGFFVLKEGVIATTRLVVSGVETVKVELESGRLVHGQVVRSYPEIDLALVRVNLTVQTLLPFTSLAKVPENTQLTALLHNGEVSQGRCRASSRSMPPHWFPTTFRELGDKGGNPVFDQRNVVVGMLTRNASRTSPDLFGLHISLIQTYADQYMREISAEPQRAYCPSCGYISRAALAGGFYCEMCGSALPNAQNINRYPMPQLEALYGDNLHRACRHCGSRVGYYNGECLRCGKKS